MRRRRSRLIGSTAAVCAALAVVGCGGGGGSSKGTATSTSNSGGGQQGGTITMVEGQPPQSLDPGFDYSGQGFEVNSVVYTGLLTYHRLNGVAGTKLMPGLATALPKITDGGRTYTMTLRKGLKFSNGKPAVASDFTYAFERAVKIPWGGSGQFMTPRVVGATAYAAGKAKTISGIVTNDSTGKIVIHLTAAYGAFENVLGAAGSRPGPDRHARSQRAEQSRRPAAARTWSRTSSRQQVVTRRQEPLLEAPLPGIPAAMPTRST